MTPTRCKLDETESTEQLRLLIAGKTHMKNLAKRRKEISHPIVVPAWRQLFDVHKVI